MNPTVANVLLMVGGIGVLYFGAEWLVRGAARIAASLGISPIVVGLTVVSLGTSAPELVVCLMAALDGNPDLAMGNVMGSNLANLGLILGLTALVRPLEVAARVVQREVPIMIVVTGLLYPLLYWGGTLDRLDGLALLVFLAFYLVFVFKTVGGETAEVLGEYEQFAEASDHVPRRQLLREVGLVAAGSLGLVLGGKAIVTGAVYVAAEAGISQLTIGLTAVAIGTSLPELATSLVAALREEADIAVGNVIGSNIFNVAAILGATAMTRPIGIDRSVLTEEMPAVLALSLLVLPVTRSQFRIRRWEGALLLAVYVGLTVWLV